MLHSTLTPCYLIESLREYNPAVVWASFFINPAIALMDAYRLKPFPCAVAYENIASAMLEQTEGEIRVDFDWLAETFPDCQRLFQTLQRESISSRHWGNRRKPSAFSLKPRCWRKDSRTAFDRQVMPKTLPSASSAPPLVTKMLGV